MEESAKHQCRIHFSSLTSGRQAASIHQSPRIARCSDGRKPPAQLIFSKFSAAFQKFLQNSTASSRTPKAEDWVGFRIFVCENTLGSVPFSQENRYNFRQVSARPGIIFFVEGHLDYGYRRLEISRKVRRVKGYLQERILRRMPDSHISSILCSSYASSGK